MLGLILVAAALVLWRGGLLQVEGPTSQEQADAAREALVRGDLELALDRSADVLGDEGAAAEAKKAALEVSSAASQLLDVRKLWQAEKRYATALGLLSQLEEKQSAAGTPGRVPSGQPPLDLTAVLAAETRAVTAEQEARAEELLRQAAKKLADGEPKAALAVLRDATAFELGGLSPGRKQRIAQLLDQALDARQRKGLEAATAGRLQEALAQLEGLVGLVRDSQDLLQDPARWLSLFEAERKQLAAERQLLSRAEQVLASADAAAARQLLAQHPEVRHAQNAWAALAVKLKALRPPTPKPAASDGSVRAGSARVSADTVFEPPPMEDLELDQIAQTAFEVESGDLSRTAPAPPAQGPAPPAQAPAAGAAAQPDPARVEAAGDVAALAGPAASSAPVKPAPGLPAEAPPPAQEVEPAAPEPVMPPARPAAAPVAAAAQPPQPAAAPPSQPAPPAVVEPPQPKPERAGPRSRPTRRAPKPEAAAPEAGPGVRSPNPRTDAVRPGRLAGAPEREPQAPSQSAALLPPQDAAQLQKRQEAAEAGRQYFLKGRQLEEQAEARKDNSYYRIAVEAYEKVPEDAERLIYVRANSKAGRILSYRLGDYAQAVAFFERAIRKDPRHPILHYEIGYAAFHLGRFDEAIKAFSKVGIYAGINPDEVKDYPKLELQMFYLNALAHEARAGRSEGDLLLLRDAISAWQSFVDSCRLSPKLCDEKRLKQAGSHHGRLRDWLKKAMASRMGESPG